MKVPDPTNPFQPLEFTVHAGEDLYRVSSNEREANISNPGVGGPTRFAFFSAPAPPVPSGGQQMDDAAPPDKIIPVLYGAQTIDAAICETMLHDIPQAGGSLRPKAYRDKIGARLSVGRELKLASFMGVGLKALKIRNAQLIDTPPTTYGRTVAWAKSAYEAGFDGAVWMSRRCNTDRAYVLFGDRVKPTELPIDPAFGQIYGVGRGLDGLIRFCAPLHIDVLVHS